MKTTILTCIFIACLLTGCGESGPDRQAREEAERRREQAERQAKEDVAFWKTFAFLVIGVVVVVIVVFAAKGPTKSDSSTPRQSQSKPVIDVQGSFSRSSRSAPPPEPSVPKPGSGAQRSLPPLPKRASPITAAPRQPKPLKNLDSYVVDGLNVCFSFDKSQPASLAVLLSVLLAIHRRGGKFICMFDATTPHVFRETTGISLQHVYKKLCEDLPRCFVQVPARTSADDFILNHADRNNLPIISNDQFKQYVQSYPWLEHDKSRRIPGLVIDGTVTILPLDIAVPLEPDASVAAKALLESMRPSNSRGG